MRTLIGQALDVLKDDAATAGMKVIAATTLLAAFETEVEVPYGASLTVWDWLSTVGRDSIRFSRVGRLPGNDVLRRALDAMKDPHVGDDLQELAAIVIEHASDLSIVTDDDILGLVDGEPGAERARRLIWVIEALHTNRGIPNAILEGFRDRWARSRHIHLRVQSCTVAGLLPEKDMNFTVKMLQDESPKVRSAAVELLERAEGRDRDPALKLLHARLDHEEHAVVRGDLHLAIGTLLRAKVGN